MPPRPPRPVLLACLAVVATASACTAVSSSRPLSGQPQSPGPSGLYVVTAPPRVPYRSLGFVQVTTHGATLDGLDGVSDTELDPVLFGELQRVAAAAGAEGVIVVSADDVGPPLPGTRPWATVRGAPRGRVATRDRHLEVTCELFIYVRDGGAAAAPTGRVP